MKSILELDSILDSILDISGTQILGVFYTV